MNRRKSAAISQGSFVGSDPVSDSNLYEICTGRSNWLSNQLLSYYKHKSSKLEREYDEILQIIENVKSACDLTNELQLELNLRNDEVSQLQRLVGDLQIHLFQEREKNLKLTAENDRLKIQDYENKKKINLLLMVNGTTEKKFCHFITTDIKGKFVPSKLPPKLKKLKEDKRKQLTEQVTSNDKENLSSNEDVDAQTLLLNNQLLESELENHIKNFKEQIEVLLREKELLTEEKSIEQQRLQKKIDSLSSKFKECQDLLCETTEKLVKSQRNHEKDKTTWMEEKDKCVKTINFLKIRLGEDPSEIWGSSSSLGNSSKARFRFESESAREKIMEKEQLAASYRQQALELEGEVNRLRERAETCRRMFKEKTEKMTAQVMYLKNKYEDLDRRRLLEAEGFRTDIRMLRERLKELEKKLAKTNQGIQTGEQQQQLLVSARNVLNRAKQLEKELGYVKTKIQLLESNEDHQSDS